MKCRYDFVTNSSSSSFIICKKDILDEQINAIRNHAEIAERMGLYCYDCPWNIEENEYYITGRTCMDNFSMRNFLDIIGVDCEHWSEYPIAMPDTLESPYRGNRHKKKTWQEILSDIENRVPCQDELIWSNVE